MHTPMDIAMLGILSDETAIAQVWIFLSLPLILAVYFRFGRVWSLRNVDLGLLLLLAYAVVLTEAGLFETTGVLFLGIGVLLLRLLTDIFLHKRPRIDSNLTPPGLLLLGLTGIGLIVTSTFLRPPDAVAREAVAHGEHIINRKTELRADESKTTTPTAALLGGPAAKITDRITRREKTSEVSEEGRKSEHDESVRITAARILAILSHLLVVSALIFLGVSLFKHAKSGMAMAALYCLLPSTILVPASVQYVLPIGFILWALATHRRPIVSGILLALACGTHVFPLFLLPIWLAYYGRTRRIHFSLAFVGSVAALLGSFAFVTRDANSFLAVSMGFMENEGLRFFSGDMRWSWMHAETAVHVLSVVAIVMLIVGLTVWPTKKSPEHLVVHSTIVIVAISFWYSQQVGQYLPSLLPLVILVAYRPGTLAERLQRRRTAPVSPTVIRPPEREPALNVTGMRSSLFR